MRDRLKQFLCMNYQGPLFQEIKAAIEHGDVCSITRTPKELIVNYHNGGETRIRTDCFPAIKQVEKI